MNFSFERVIAWVDWTVHKIIQPIWTLLMLALLAGSGWYWYASATHPQPGYETEHAGEIAALCNADHACSAYKTARFDCATAGNIAKCMSIRLGVEELPSDAVAFVNSLPGICEPDGHLKGWLKDQLIRATKRYTWPPPEECLRVGAK